MYKPNRLVIFLHSSQSFRGVTELRKNLCDRSTIYMDYNMKKTSLEDLTVQSEKAGSKFIPRYWIHQTTFMPIDTWEFRTFYVYSKYLAKRFLRRF